MRGRQERAPRGLNDIVTTGVISPTGERFVVATARSARGEGFDTFSLNLSPTARVIRGVGDELTYVDEGSDQLFTELPDSPRRSRTFTRAILTHSERVRSLRDKGGK